MPINNLKMILNFILLIKHRSIFMGEKVCANVRHNFGFECSKLGKEKCYNVEILSRVPHAALMEKLDQVYTYTVPVQAYIYVDGNGLMA